MARALRIEYPGAFYHVTCRGNDRKPIFRDDQDRKAFLNRLEISLNHYQANLHVYVLMNNHFHLVVETPRGNLSELMRHFNVTYTGYFNRRHGRVGHLYQGRFKAILVEADAYLLELSRYVHLNPIRVVNFKKVSVREKRRHLEGYRWSSLGGYLRRKDREGFVCYQKVLDYLGGDHERGRQAYIVLMESGIKTGVVDPWEEVKGQVLLGRETFVEKMRRHLDPAMREAREQPAVRVMWKHWDAEKLIKRVADVLGREVQDLCRRGGGLDRAIVMECLHRHVRKSQREIGRRMGGVDYTWVSRMRGKLRQAVQENEVARRLFQKVEAALLTQE